MAERFNKIWNMHISAQRIPKIGKLEVVAGVYGTDIRVRDSEADEDCVDASLASATTSVSRMADRHGETDLRGIF